MLTDTSIFQSRQIKQNKKGIYSFGFCVLIDLDVNLSQIISILLRSWWRYRNGIFGCSYSLLLIRHVETWFAKETYVDLITIDSFFRKISWYGEYLTEFKDNYTYTYVYILIYSVTCQPAVGCATGVAQRSVARQRPLNDSRQNTRCAALRGGGVFSAEPRWRHATALDYVFSAQPRWRHTAARSFPR
jgi:hypothetical protein